MTAEVNYFKVNRQLLHSDRWLAEKFTRAQAWVDLFGLAQHSNNYLIVRGIKVETKRGQLAYSQLSLASRWHWSRNKVRCFLKCLEKDGDIIQQNNEVTTLITIVKYDFWQGKSNDDGSSEKIVKNTFQKVKSKTIEKTIQQKSDVFTHKIAHADTKTEQQTIQQKDNRKTTESTHTKNDKNVKNEKKEDISHLREIVECYKELKGFKDDKAWDRAHFPRACKAAKTLLQYIGSVTECFSCMRFVADDMTREGLDWTLETIVKRSAEWKNGRAKSENVEKKAQEEIKKALEYTKRIGAI